MPIKDFSQVPLEKLISLQGRTAVVTGGARGIGLAIAKRMSEAGANILIADIDTGGCMKNALQEIGRSFGCVLDAREPEDMERAASEAINRFGRVDIWVNDAGIYPEKPFLKLNEKLLSEVIDTNIKGVFYGSQAAIRAMEKNGGVILNLSSVAGFKGTEEMAHYNATKFAVRGLTASLAKEFGDKNIRVVAIAPSFVDTPGVHEEVKNLKKEMREKEEKIALGRVSVPDDIARISLVLVSDLAAFVTGTTFVVDGGDMSLG